MASFLENPLRNGTLLCEVAQAVTGAPVIADVEAVPRDTRAARANILAALDSLGLLERKWAPPEVGWDDCIPASELLLVQMQRLTLGPLLVVTGVI